MSQHTPYQKLDCCWIGDEQIAMCPLHAAAPELLVILKDLVAAYPYASNTYAPWTTARALLARIEGA